MMTDRDPKHSVASALLILSTDGQLLMVENPYRQDLVLPGGVVEADESPRSAAEREVREETGLHLVARTLLVVHHKPASGGSASGLRFIFSTDLLSPDVALIPQPGEVTALHWLNPADAVRRHVVTGRERVALALQARRDARVVYLDGDGSL